MRELEDNDADIQAIEYVVGRGGLLKPLNAGVYEVNEQMVNDLKVVPKAGIILTWEG